MPKAATVVVAGCGNRGLYAYAPYAKQNPERMKIVGCADLLPERVRMMREEYGVPEEACFSSAEELFRQPRMADIAFICTQDRDHVGHAMLAIDKGYDLLLEKPVSPDPSECKRLLKFAEERGSHVTVCHVLRYTPFYQAIKRQIEAGAVGEIVNINAAENVCYWHQAHSFVRGNWRNSDETSPMILQKSCHDMDILLWLAGKGCRRVSSFGGNHLFRPEMAPEGAALRCLDGCRCKKDCVYDAEKIYLTQRDTGFLNNPDNWLSKILCDPPTEAGLREAIRTGPYGRCVYHCDNNVVDHQQVDLELEDGSTIGFSMSAFSATCYRTIQIMGTRGEINGNIDKEQITVSRFGGEPEVIDLSVRETIGGHGGGDGLLMESLIGLALGEAEGDSSLTSLDRSLESHYVALAAEESRQNGGSPVAMKAFIDRIPE